MAFIASKQSVTANHCTLCYGTEESLDIPFPNAPALVDGTTCDKLGKFSQFKAERDDVCLEYYQFIGYSKCGCEAPRQETVKPSCSLCYDQSLPTSPDSMFDYSTSTTCQEAYDYLGHFEQNDSTCRSFQHLGVTNCGCPYRLPEQKKCTLCDENERLLDPNHEISEDGTTCGMVEYLLAIDFEENYTSPGICDRAKQGFSEKCTCVPVDPTLPPSPSPTTSPPTQSPTPSLEEACDDIQNGVTPVIPEFAQSDVGGYELNVMIASDASIDSVAPLLEKEITKVVSASARGCDRRRLHSLDDKDDDLNSSYIIHFVDFFDLKDKESVLCSKDDGKGFRCHVLQGVFEVSYSTTELKENRRQERLLDAINITENVLALLQQRIDEINIEGIEEVIYIPLNNSASNDRESNEGDDSRDKNDKNSSIGTSATIGLSVSASLVALVALGYGCKTKVKSLPKSRKQFIGKTKPDEEQFYHPDVHMRSDDSISNSPSSYNCVNPNGDGATIDFLNPILLIDDEDRSESDAEMPYDERDCVEVVCADSVYSASTSQFEELYANA